MAAKELSQRRRWVLKGLGLTATAAAFAPYAPFGQFLLKAVGVQKEEKKIANIKDEDIAAPGSAKLFSFPRPAEEDPFSSSVLVHLFDEDAEKTGIQFMGFNRTCVHLRCLVNFQNDRNQIECPCHGSVYRTTDAKPIGGPAELLGLNPLPEIVLRIDEKGDIYAISLNGSIGFGRTQNIQTTEQKL